ncbi:MAG: choice-of-anchor D domain-containing protein [Bacteroidota bacterium]|nr:choice-of-anchor D domain-containing protein [Candidatus Kapabacteria bacterium]MDW8218969.1 choice-of-anchor D domain-containing protein [Bacteroidota bacterium]
MYTQSLTLFDVNASAFPVVRAKFFALDADGKPLTDISARDVVVREHGVPRTVTAVVCSPQQSTVRSLSVVLTIDVSGSMKEGTSGVSHLSLAQAAARAWVQAMPEENVECAITSYDHISYLNQDFTQDRKRLLKAIANLKPQGGTDYDAGLLRPQGGSLFVMQNAKYSRRIVIFLTDGQGGGTEEQIIEVAKSDGVSIYCIAVGMPAPEILRNIARQTGGECFDNITTVQQAEQIYRILLQFALGSKPCEVSWLSEQTCSVSRVQATLSLPARLLSHAFTYEIPAKAVKALEFSSENITFGGVPPGKSREMRLVLRARNSAFTVNSIESSDERFSVTPTYFTLKSGQRKVVTVKYTPTDSGYAFATLTVNDNVCGNHTLYVSAGFPGKKPQQSTLKLLEPNGGEQYVAGCDTVIRWQGITPSEAVSIEFSDDNGASWQKIIPATSGLRTDWQIPKTSTTRALVRLRQLQSPTFSHFKDLMTSAVFLPDNRTAVTLGSGGVARAWNLDKGTMGQIYFSNQFGQRKSTLLPGKLVVTPQGEYVIGGFDEGTVRIWDAASGDLVDVYYDHADAITALRFFPSDGSRVSRVLTASLDSTARVWYIENAETALVLKHNGPVYDAVVSPDGSLIATAGGDSVAMLWDAKTGELLYRCEGHTDVVLSAAFSPDSKKLLTTSADGTARIWDTRKGTQLERFTGHRSVVYMGIFSPDGERVVTCSADSTIKVWSGKGGGWIQNLRGHQGIVRKIMFVPNSSAILSSVSSDRTARIWDLSAGRTVQILGGVEARSKSSVGSGIGIADGHTGAVYDMVFSPNGAYAATVGTDHKVYFWRINTTASVSAGSIFRSSPLIWALDTTAVQEAISAAPFTITQPRFSVKSIDMGRQLRGDSKDSVIVACIQNEDNTPLRIDELSFLGSAAQDYSIVSGGAPCIVPPKGSRNLEVRFKPCCVGGRPAQLRIVSQSDVRYVSVTGAGVSPLIVVMNRSVDFEEVKIRQYRDTVVTVLKNISLQPVIITGISFIGPNTTDFRLVGNASQIIRTDTSYILYPNATLSLRLRFKPTNSGRTSCQMNIEYSGLGSPATVQLFGTGNSALSAYIQPFGVKPHPSSSRKDSVEYPIQALRVEEFLATTMHPLLNYIFFDNNSFTLPRRYNQLTPEQARRLIETKQAFEKVLSAQSTLDVYRNVLNIIGSRMLLYPSSMLTIVGCKSGKEKFVIPATQARVLALSASNAQTITTTQANMVPATTSQLTLVEHASILQKLTAQDDMRLSEARALAVREYLHTVWGIPEERMPIQFRGLPEKFSNEQIPDGIAENRRVELIPSIPELTATVLAQDTLRVVVPPVVRFRTNALSQANLTTWNVAVVQSTGSRSRKTTQILKTVSGTGKPQERIEWNTEREVSTAPKLTVPVQYSLSVNDDSGANTIASGSLPLELISISKKRAAKAADKEVNTFGLLLFDFNRAEITGQNANVLEFVRKQILPESRVSIVGYTDRTGSSLLNKSLSLQRAKAAASALSRPDALVQGRGSDGLLHDNTTPEGRFYCRTVNIVVENAIR